MSKINALRKLETQAQGHFLYLMAIAGTLSNIGGTASFLATLAAYAVMLSQGWGDLPPLDISQIFTLFTIVSLLSGTSAGRVVQCASLNISLGPLNRIGQQLPSLFASLASLERIQGFLQLPEKAESEKLAEADLVDVSADGGKESVVEVSLKGCTFAWDEKTDVLKDITLELVPRELHMVVGSVASVRFWLCMLVQRY
jgi:ABC-type multidrug transport system fused ATPase/permease subunit